MKRLLNFLKEKDNYILFFSHDNKNILLFSDHLKIIKSDKFKDIKKNLFLLDSYIARGYFIAGYISYEAGYLFNELKYSLKPHFPLLYFGVYKKPEKIKKEDIAINNDDFVIFNIQNNIEFDEYKSDIKKIKNYLKNGEVYQINYCFKEKFRFFGSAESLFFKLTQIQKTGYSFMIKNNNYYILSISPEMFFYIKNKEITMKPMKGTLLKSKINNLNELKNEKNKAENIMIVDLIRNDLGKICKINSIYVPEKFSIEEYASIYQMTSTIKGKLNDNIKLSDIITALFPSGSVTGAPKRRAIQIINSLEKEQRGIYTGSIGFFSKNKALFNIAIRTSIINKITNEGEMGIGSGIVYDSKTKKEYKECLIKAKFLNSLENDFKIFESILFSKKNGFSLLPLHLKRMENACKQFDFKFNKTKIREALFYCVKKIKTDDCFKVRIFIDFWGNLKTDYQKIKSDSENKKIKLYISDERVDSKNIFLYFKTNKREFYEKNFKKAQQCGYDDVVFLNERDEITECSSSNIFIEKDGISYTPPVSSGLLNGTYRQYLLATEPLKYKEKILYKKDILNADSIFICNSVRGMRKAVI